MAASLAIGYSLSIYRDTHCNDIQKNWKFVIMAVYVTALRAQSVADVLQVKFNIDETIIEAIGRGEEELFDKSDTYHAH
jgi:hypothetical protein